MCVYSTMPCHLSHVCENSCCILASALKALHTSILSSTVSASSTAFRNFVDGSGLIYLIQYVRGPGRVGLPKPLRPHDTASVKSCTGRTMPSGEHRAECGPPPVKETPRHWARHARSEVPVSHWRRRLPAALPLQLALALCPALWLPLGGGCSTMPHEPW
jgi:hypothetical protein